MRKILLLFGLLLAAGLIFTYCSIWDSETETSALEVEEATGEALTGAVIAVPAEEPIYNIRVHELKKLSESVTTYKYLFHSNHLNSAGLVVEDESYGVSINGYLIKKSYHEAALYESWPYFDVYMNLQEKSAWGVCSKPAVTCQPEFWKKAHTVSYFQEQLVFTPLKLMQELGNNAKVMGEILYGTRQVTLVETKLEGEKTQRLYVDNYYGLPLRMAIFQLDKDKKEVILNDYYFDLISAGLGSVKLSEVTLPEDVVKVE